MRGIRNNAGQRGFSFIEMVVAIGLFVLIMLAIINLYATYQTLFGVEGATVDVVHSASRTLNEVHDAVLQADRIVASYTFAGSTYATGSTTLVVELPSVSSTGDIVAGSFDYIGFYSSSTRAYEVTAAASGSARRSGVKDLSDVLQSITFTYNASTPAEATSTDADVLTSTVVKGKTVAAYLHQKTYMRNQ